MLKKVCTLGLFISVCIVAYWWVTVVVVGIFASDTLEIHFLDVGQGDATLIQTPNKRQILVDASRGIQVLQPLQEILSSYDKHIDVVVLTHPDADHIGGFVPVLDIYDISYAFHSYIPFAGTKVAQRVGILLEEALPSEKDRIAVSDYYSFTLDGVEFEILWPLSTYSTDRNYASVVVLVRYGEIEMLLMGDVPKAVEHEIIRMFPEQLRDVEILKLGHHGSKTSTAATFLEHLMPSVAVISAGANNSYGHPHDIVLDTVTAYGKTYPDKQVAVYETKDGTISFCVDKESFEVCS